MRQLQKEQADAQKKQSASEFTLHVSSQCHLNLQEEIRDLMKKVDAIRSQVCMKFNMSTDDVHLLQ